jgi:hypothetical protein
MTADYITALASVGTLLVITATALAAFVQLRHLRTNNVLMVLNDFRETYERPEMRAAYEALPKAVARLEDPEARRELENPSSVEWVRPIFPLLRLFETLGSYTNRGVVPRDLLCDMWSPVLLETWTMSAPLIAIMRRTAGPAMFENFEMLAVISERWLDENHEVYPRNLPRMKLIDAWADVDRPSHSNRDTPNGKSRAETTVTAPESQST